MSTTGSEGIVVLGAPRSGTTLVRRLLNAHPAIHCPPETNLLNGCARFLEEEEFAGGVRVGVVPGLAFSNVAESEVLDALREVAFGFLRRLAAKQGKRRWAEKTAFDIFHLPAIERLCGDRCQFVCLVRHGLDVTCSIKELSDRMGRYVSELHPYIRLYPRPLEAFATAWRDVTLQLRAFVDARPDRAMVLRYEDLVQQPADAIGRLFDFLGEPADVPSLVETLSAPDFNPGLGDWKTYQRKGFDPSSLDRWTTLEPDTVQWLRPIVNPALEAFGYAPVPEQPRVGEDVARRRYQLSLVATQLR